MRFWMTSTASLLGQVKVPGSKSMSIRGLFLASLCAGESCLFNFLSAEDTQDAIRVCRQLGASIIQEADTCRIVGVDKQAARGMVTQKTVFVSGNSGITSCFLLPLLGLRDNAAQVIRVDCGEQMRGRPIAALVNALRQLGLSIDYADQSGFFPLLISGCLQGGKIRMDGGSSQQVSALLLALPCAQQDSEIWVENLVSRPYLEMTIDCLNAQKIQYTQTVRSGRTLFCIQGRQRYKAFRQLISGDFSSASYCIAAAVLIPGSVEIFGLNGDDSQGDKRLISILQTMGAAITVNSTSLLIEGGKPLQGIKIEARDIPDLLPTLAVIGTQALGKTEIMQVKHARTKETDRIRSMTLGLRQLGAHIEEKEEGMVVYQSQLKGAALEGCGDHRTVMALSLAGLLASGISSVTNAEAVAKTFPGFLTSMQALGATIKEGA